MSYIICNVSFDRRLHVRSSPPPEDMFVSSFFDIIACKSQLSLPFVVPHLHHVGGSFSGRIPSLIPDIVPCVKLAKNPKWNILRLILLNVSILVVDTIRTDSIPISHMTGNRSFLPLRS